VDTYEIRVASPVEVGMVIYSSSHLDDEKAIERALVLAKPDDVIEVWRGLDCVYCGKASWASNASRRRADDNDGQSGRMDRKI
jgi:hypothetical protein